MPTTLDGPATSAFTPLSFRGNLSLAQLAEAGCSEQMSANAAHAPTGACVAWGIPFEVKRPLLIQDKPVTVKLGDVKAPWLVFMHTSDLRHFDADAVDDPRRRGEGRLSEHAANYVVVYADGSEQSVPILRRRQLGMFQRRWGENCFEAVAHLKHRPVPANHEQPTPGWGHSQTRASTRDGGPWVNWLWAWENPHPRKLIAAIRFEPVSGRVLISGVSAGAASEHPLRWRSRRKAVLTLPKGEPLSPALDDNGLLAQVQLDMGQVISAVRRPVYPADCWARTYNNALPEVSECEVLVEYTAHPDARFHLADGKTVPVGRLEDKGKAGTLRTVAPATQRVTLRAVEKETGRAVPVKLHLHGEAGEYLAPVDRHRLPNASWFEDYSVDFLHAGTHWCTYIPGETTVDLPLGQVYLEVSKGFEIKPIRKVLRVTPQTTKVVVEIEKVLPWRERGWVSADTHVHFLSPTSALLEGSGEGVNVVNLLASQWGELMTNVGDFDGKTTHGAREAGGDGEYLVRVGTENRQHVLGHISLIGYEGRVIAPMTTGGPDESALGDPVECLLTEWARQCKQREGVVVLPHFLNPRAEHAASVVSGDIDAVEMTSWGNLYAGIDPYSLADWYRYLNCGYRIAAVGGTDKMTANTAVGAVRTYAQVAPEQGFSYDAWKDAVRAGRTFVTYGPLLEWQVDGHSPGKQIEMTSTGGTVDVTWNAATVTVPMSRIELIVNGEVRESRAVRKWGDAGQWSVRLDRSSWLALLVRGHYPDKPEIIAAHSSPTMVNIEGSQLLAAADAVTILDQIEGALAYLDTVGTRAETKAYKRMRLVLTGAHRSLHNRMHQRGDYHKHTPVDDHPAHHG